MDHSKEFSLKQRQSLQQQQEVQQEEAISMRDKLCISARHTTLPQNIVTGVTIWTSQASTNNLQQVCSKHL